MIAKNWRELSDVKIRMLLADENTDEAFKDEIVRDGMSTVQAGWSPQEEISRRRWCAESADTPVVHLLSQLRNGTQKRMWRLLDRCGDRERTASCEEEE